jgi:hypothetical protein
MIQGAVKAEIRMSKSKVVDAVGRALLTVACELVKTSGATVTALRNRAIFPVEARIPKAVSVAPPK